MTGSFLNIAAMVFGPWTGWVHVTLQFSARGLIFFGSAILMTQNCTQLVGMRSTKSVWIARQAPHQGDAVEVGRHDGTSGLARERVLAQS